MKALVTAVAVGTLMLLPGTALAQDYPATTDPVAISCSFSAGQVSCSGTDFEPDSTVTVTVDPASEATVADQTASSTGAVSFSFAPACAVDSITVTASGTDADGNADSDDAVVDISTCAPDTGSVDDDDALPQTGGGLALGAGLALAGSALLAGRRRA